MATPPTGEPRSLGLTIAPLTTIFAVSTSPQSVTGGKVAMGEVVLSAPAPSGGAVVNLSSNTPFATVPKSVRVYARESSATFSIKTKQVISTISATISATYGSTINTILTIIAKGSALSSVTLNPTSVSGGTSSQGTVSLTSSAPTGGVVVALGSDKPSVATPPPTVTVPAGSNSATFTINTTVVGSDTSAMISATYGGATSGSSLTVQSPPGGAQFYAAPNGSASGNGSLSSPWDLQTALNQPAAVQPGATINMRGGTYTGRFVSNLTGSAASPITVRSYSGEWARIEGYATSTLNGAISATASSLVLVDGSKFGENQEVLIDMEVILLYVKTGANTFTILRGRSGGTAAGTHSSAATVVGVSNIVTVNGSYTNYRDFEVTSTYPVRAYADLTLDPSHVRGEGVAVFGPNTKLINLIIHDAEDGIGFWDSATDSEISGCIVYNNGVVMPDRSHGHGVYIQNQTGAKLIKDVISVNNFTTGMKAFGVNGFAENIRFDGNMSFNNGSTSTFAGNSAGYDAAHRFSNLLVATRNNPMHNITITNNYLYSPSGTVPE
ncbi:MAG TPA: hypothetical protein VKF81_14570, partial [Blastocatellia bacterium]|nr:hypothetical protein [Blastocatellia bacterium]